MKTIFAIIFFLAVTIPTLAQDCNVEIIKSTPVVYPDSAKAKGIEGTVWVQATIGIDGFVKTAMVSKSDNEILNEAALDAIVRWQFKPLSQDCKVTLPIKFKLSK